MRERGLRAELPRDVVDELRDIQRPAAADGSDGLRDMRELLWCSIDNDDSMDLDQLSAAEELPGGGARILVAIADVDALVPLASAIDRHAHANTTSIYTPTRIFPMLPERLSTDLTSFSPEEDRAAVIVDMKLDRDGHLKSADVYRAAVHNYAKLAYPSLAAWLEGQAPMPPRVQAVPGLDAAIRTQDRMAQAMRDRRQELGALDLETIEVRAVMEGDAVQDLRAERKNRAKELIEDLMVAANGVVARFLAGKRFPSLRRVVRSPERWERIVELAADFQEKLPPEPDAVALQAFLVHRRRADPIRFPDLSLSVIKLMGAGEYAVEAPGQTPVGHFGLAVRDYTHSTAPNRRYPDLITQRLIKAALAGERCPYDRAELDALAKHCTDREDAANKVERSTRKAAAACVMTSHIGEEFDGIVTGASNKGTWARVLDPPFEGRVERGFEGLDVGDRVRLRLLSTDVERGFIDFAALGQSPRARRGQRG